MALPKFKSHWDRGNPAEVARNRLRNAVKSGRIAKPDACELCARADRLFGHHWRGYGYPFDVWWVCVSCNTRLTAHDGSQTVAQAKEYVMASGDKKTDNHNLAGKLALRRALLKRYHDGQYFSVFDCCQGDGRIWKKLRKEFECSYWGADKKRKPGRLVVDSVRVLSIDGFSADVVDVDTYGSPWKHWLALLPQIAAPTTVFLTEGLVRVMGGGVDPVVPEALGMRFPRRKVPNVLVLSLPRELIWKTMIAQAGKHGLHVRAIVEAPNEGTARYLGVRLEPIPPETA